MKRQPNLFDTGDLEVVDHFKDYPEYKQIIREQGKGPEGAMCGCCLHFMSEPVLQDWNECALTLDLVSYDEYIDGDDPLCGYSWSSGWPACGAYFGTATKAEKKELELDADTRASLETE